MGLKNMLFYKKISVFLSLATAVLLATQPCFSQNNRDTLKMEAIVYQGDTIPLSNLLNLYVYAHLTAAQREAAAKYNRLRNAIYVTYPYARKAGVVLNEINQKIAGIEDRKTRKKIINSREKELKREFTTPLTNLSIYQGKVLMKLINRETGNSCYEIIKEYKGGLTAGIYQTVAFFFSTSLKQSYDPKNDDLVIEKIVKEVQRLYGFNEIDRPSNL